MLGEHERNVGVYFHGLSGWIRLRDRHARRTPAGHLIVRVDTSGSDETDWRFLGNIDLPEASSVVTSTKLRIKTSAGRRVIALEDSRGEGIVRFALGPGASRTSEGGQARTQLLEWTRQIEVERGIEVKEVFWDNESGYWLEIGGEQIPYEGQIAPLEFGR